ncbi:hypothetical protein UlMin_025003 [Ulmus minor]
MEQGEILKLVSSLKLDAEEDEYVLMVGDISRMWERKLNSCLACKVLSSKAMPRDVFRSQLPKILQVVENVNVELIENNIFIVEFSSLRDMKRVLTNGSWNLFKNLVIFIEIQESSNISSLNFNFLELWVQVHNVLLSCMNRDCAEIIGNRIGWFSEVAMGDKGVCWGRFLRIRIVVDISMPLKRLVKLCLKEGSTPDTLLLQFERLPIFCYRCGMLGHQVQECLEEATMDDEGKEVLKYGVWMMASPGANRHGMFGWVEWNGMKCVGSTIKSITMFS